MSAGRATATARSAKLSTDITSPRHHLAAASPRAKTIKLADITDNCEDICKHDPRFGRTYLLEIHALMEVLRKGDPRLYEKAARKIELCGRNLGITLPSVPDPFNRLTGAAPNGAIPRRHGIRLFTEAFAARDILETFPSFDAETLIISPDTVAALSNCSLIGIRTNGKITGYLTREDIVSKETVNSRAIEQRQLLDLETSLADVIHLLTYFSCCFVTLNDAIIGVITRRDIEK